jgi:hypothetical protein
MKNFFTAIGYIFLVALSIVIYYLIRDFLQKKVIERMIIKLQKKNCSDQKYYLLSYLEYHLLCLVREELTWIQVFSKKYPFNQVQLIYDRINDNINIMTNSREIGQEVKSRLIQLGIRRFVKENEFYIFGTKVNAQRITEIIFFIFAKVYNQESNCHLKIKAS